MTKAQGEVSQTAEGPILIGLGANLPSARFGAPRRTLEATLNELTRRGVVIRKRSRWYESAPVPASDQPWFVNGVVEVATALDPVALLEVLHAIEDWLGRIRREPNGPRAVDLDLLTYGHVVRSEGAPILPHPRLYGRAFVLYPLAEIAPGWRDPVSGASVQALLARLPPGQAIRVLETGSSP